MSNKIIPTHYKSITDIDRQASIVQNAFSDAKEIKIRNIKTVDVSQRMLPDVAPIYGGESRYNINTHTGLLNGKDLNINITINPTTVSAGTGAYADGFILNSIRRIRAFSGAQEIMNITAAGIWQYYQRMHAEKKTFMASQCRIGSTGAAVAINAAQSGCIWIPNPFQDYHLLKTELLNQSNFYIVVEWNALSNIVYSTLAATFTGSLSAYLTCTYLETSPEAKREIVARNISQNEYVECLDVPIASGSTTITVDIPFHESEYIHFFIEDATTHAPFTGVSNINEFYVSIDNSRFPDAIFNLNDESLKNIQYFQRVFSPNHHTIRFASISSRDDYMEDYHIMHGSVIWRQIGYPKLTINMTSLTNNSILHVMSFGRATYRYSNGSLFVEKKA